MCRSRADFATDRSRPGIAKWVAAELDGDACATPRRSGMLGCMTCALDATFGGLVATLPESFDGDTDEFVFTRDVLPQPTPVMATDRLVIRAGEHEYNGCHTEDMLDFYFAGNASPRALGVLVLAVLFHPDPETVEVQLTNPRSDIRRLRLRYTHSPGGGAEYFATPTFFRYRPSEVRRHVEPWVHLLHRSDLPELCLTTESELGQITAAEAELEPRDTVVGFGREAAMLFIAALLLDFGIDQDQREIDLESDAGFGGVGPSSAEMRLWLPGSAAWSEEDFA